MDDLTLQLRLRDVSGADIGAVLEETRQHLTESGESAYEAFGPVVDYVNELALARGWTDESQALATEWSRSDFVLGAIHMTGWFVLFGAVSNWILGESFELTPGMIAGLVLGVAMLAWLVWPAFVSFLSGRAGKVVPIAALVVSLALMVTVMATWNEPVLASVPPYWVVLVAVGVMALSIWDVARSADPVTPPRTDE